jgi:DegV family protein with EDD domain
MGKVAIVTDSVASIPESILEALDIQWVPYYIHWGKEVMRDLTTIQRDTFYKWLPTIEELPTTASPGPGDYLEIYQRLASEGVQEIVSIHITSRGSGAYQAARAAQSMLKEELPDLIVEVIDTLNVSMCHGWMVIEAARAAVAGKSLSSIVDLVRA